MGHHHPFLFSLFLLLFSTATADDGATILKLANSITPLPSGWSTKSSTTFCSWHGINCDSSKSRVTSISLSKLSLSGTLPPEISTLSELQSLSVQGNQLSGDLPSLANLTNLQYIFLDSNNFTSIPPGFFQGLTGLQTLSIGNNVNLSPWKLPTDLAQCTSLTTLTANDCQLFGSIPDVFGSLPSLQNLRLSYNNLTGVLPPSFANSGIQNLWVNNQQIGLSGSIEVIGSITQLSQVWLHVNQFTGPIPDLTECKSIFDLQLRDNQLTGIVPASLVSLPNLVNVSLSNNKFQGPVPQFPPSVITVKNEGINKYCAGPGAPCDALVMTLLEIAGGFGYPSTLSDKWDGNDACGWPLVTCDAGKKNVVTVNLAKQQFTGSISPSFAKLSSLKSLYLNENNLTGSIPDSLTKLPELETLDVSNNNLSGKIPEFPGSVKLITKPGNPFLRTDVDTSSGGTTNGTSSGGTTSGGSSAGSTKIPGGMIAGIIVAVVIFIVVLSFILYKYKKRHPKSGKELKQDGGKAFFKNEVAGGGNGYNKVPIALHGQSSDGDNSKNIFEGGNVAVPIEFLRQENIPKAIDESLNPDEETLATIYTVTELAGHCTARDPYQRPDMGHAVNVLAPLVKQWRPASQQEDQNCGTDLDTNLPETLRRWQTEEGTSTMSDDTSFTQTRSSVPSMTSGFSDTFTSNDCR
uniref:Putative receptor protein kinase TMK1 n=1 Tax=Populus alba TaxID=43335 RepID=A0A4U5R1Q4_POPAL|nr:putative receptor protein kinase TMK1 [Populus alba]